MPKRVTEPKKFLLKGSPKGGEIRQHYYLNRYVVIAPLRGKRPDAFAKGDTHLTETANSPAIETEKGLLEIKDEHGNWQVKVINNAFPALSLDNLHAFGKQEIVIETPHHNTEFSQLPISQILRIFEAFKTRIQALEKIEGVAYVVVFKNDGPRAGATLAHAHSQIVALPLLPPVVEDEAAAVEEYKLHHGSCPVCDVIAWEKQEKVRIVYEDDHAICFCPYAASAPYAVWVVPKTHRNRFEHFTAPELESTAHILKKVATQLDKYGISFNYFIHNALPTQDHHAIIKVEPRPNVWGGLELSTGVIINPVPPEHAADWYRTGA